MFNLNKTWFTTKVLWSLYVMVILYFQSRGDIQTISFSPKDLMIVGLGFISLFLLSETFNHTCKSRISRTFWGIFLIILYYFGFKYHYRTTSGFDYATFINNIRDAFNPESANVILDTFKVKDLLLAAYAIPALIILELWKKIFSKNFEHRSLRFGVVLIALYITAVFNSPYLYEKISYTVKTALDYHFKPTEKGSLYSELSKKENPFLTTFTSDNKDQKPHIFLVALESFNGLYINKKVEDKFVTPVLNELIHEGLYIEHFYGNSIQTVKGHFSILCSRLPLIQGKASYRVSADKVDCLPKTLESNGYQNLFFQSFGNIGFDNTQNFMEIVGFKNIKSASPYLLTEVQRVENIWGWGIQDNFSYKQFIDESLELIKKSDRPLFSMMATISHHMKFNRIPMPQRFLFPGEKGEGRKERFLNSLHLSDKYLGEFISLLKEKNLYENSLIIITGDHSFPAGEHDYYSNEMGSFEENFKVPFIAIWKGKIAPKKIDHLAFSQIDIAPTIYELIHFNGDARVMGQSMLSATESFAPVLQPYDGQYIGAIEWPKKYIWSKRYDETVVYDLESDPLEKEPKEVPSEASLKVRDLFHFNEEFLQ